MSVSNEQNQVESPVRHYWEYKAEHGNARFTRWDKEEKKNVDITSINFMPLCFRSTVRGYSDQYKGKIFANDTENLKENKLFVRAFTKDKAGNNKTVELVSGYWEDIKDTVKAEGGKYGLNIYVMVKDEDAPDGRAIDCLTLSGSGSGSWFDFVTKSGIKGWAGRIVSWDGSVEEKKKGATKFDTPIWKHQESDADQQKAQIAKDVELQKFFKAKEEQQKAQNEKEPEPEAGGHDAQEDEDDDQIPF